jgi:LuxR family transcriptional regulator, activator of conjugal transfer of Ti plasmids
MTINTRLIEDTIESLRILQTPKEFQDFWSEIACELGFSSFTYVGVQIGRDRLSEIVGHKRIPVYLTTVDPRWEQEYVQSAFFSSDPVVREALAHPIPIVSLDLIKRQALSKSGQLVMNRAHDFSLSKVLTIPVHAFGGDIGIMSLYSSESDAEFYRCVSAFQHTLHVLAIHFHTIVQDVLGEPDSMLQQVPLTPRELECLHWTAKGKTAWEIGQIIQISDRTVHHHVMSAFEKLRVVNKTHAVAKAVSLGLAAP